MNGRSSGAAINVITKSGSNSFHGSVFGFFRDQALNADQKLPDPANNTTTSSNPPYSRQWFGGSVGGPFKKDKLFGFFAFERQREHTSLAEQPSALTQLQLVPLLAHSLLPLSRDRSLRTASMAAWTTSLTQNILLTFRSQPRPMTA